MTSSARIATALAAVFLAAPAFAQITFYPGEGFRGRAFSTSEAVPDLGRRDFDNRASSIVVERGRWEVCEDSRFRGRCVVLRRGSYDSLDKLGLDERISSVRPADSRRRYDNEAEAPMETPNYAYRQRANERVYEAPVTSARAVMEASTQRCWVERQQVAPAANNNTNIGGAVAGALIGGILGHQVGGGSGKDLATAGGAVAGAVVGSNMAGGGGGGAVAGTRDVQRCENNVSGTPAYWDVTYNFRGREHQLQMSAAPGRSILVNDRGEPRQ
jgi:uncharacterized protein YcfJ